MEAIVVLLLAAAVYFLPTIVATNRNHKNCSSIFVINLFLGWTLLGWVAALAWSLTDNTKQ